MSATGNRANKARQVRIIGGRWRGRKLSFTPASGLRPTGDRVRETLFNWLAPDIHGARCADLFAGSGALGLEALSRGAQHCDFVDTTGGVVTQIAAHLKTLQAQDLAACHTADALQFLQSVTAPYDIIFVDPPFSLPLVEPVCAALDDAALLAQGALIYIETAASEPTPRVPPHWVLHREKTAGDVAYRLFRND